MQAARGTSVEPGGSTGDEAGGGDTTTEPRARIWLLFAAVAAVLYAVDVVTKIIAVNRLTDRDDVSVIGSLLQLHLTRNAGAAFSTGTEYTVALSSVAVVAVLVVLWLSRRLGSVGWAVALGALLAGIGGNLTDRIAREPGPFRGHVIDFLMLPNWPVFNVADICINIGAGLILVQAFRGVRINGSREKKSGGRPEAEPEPAE
jgi:signal peptidase II